VKDECPVFVVIYKKIKKSSDSTLRKVVGSIFTAQIAAGNMSTTPLERDMLAKLLLLNSKRLSSDHNPERRKNEDSFRLSFLLPLGPISMQDLGKLTNTSGCAVCGDTHKALRRCADCQSISYCSQGEALTCQIFRLDLIFRFQNVNEGTGNNTKPHVVHSKAVTGDRSPSG
jgi:hypothetical protein